MKLRCMELGKITNKRLKMVFPVLIVMLVSGSMTFSADMCNPPMKM